jgi:3-isopropylmalate/(R)-2-methylmalate dehydratase small subunit
VGAILAQSFSRIFYRNAINFGLPLLVFPQASQVAAGALLELNPVTGMIRDATAGQTYVVEGIPTHLMEMIDAGGLMPWLHKKYGKSRSQV